MIERAARNGFGAELFFAASDEHDDRNVVRLGLYPEEGGEPDAVGQREIEEDDVDAAASKPHQGGCERGDDFKTIGLAVNFGQLLADHPLIIRARVDEQYGGAVSHAAASIARGRALAAAYSARRAHDHEQILRVDLHARSGKHFGDVAIGFRAHRGLHLHRLKRDQQVAARDFLSCPDRNGDYRTGHRRADVGGIARLDLALCRPLRDLAAIRDAHRARQTIEFEKDSTSAVIVNLAHGNEAHDQRLAALELKTDLLARLQAVKKHRARQCAHISEAQAVRGVVGEHLRIHEVRGELRVADLATTASRGLSALALEVRRSKYLARAHLEWLRVLQNLALQGLWKATVRLAEITAKELYDRFRKRNFHCRIEHGPGREPGGDHHQCQIPHHLRGRRDLDDVAEHLIHLAVRARHFRRAMLLDTKRARLLTQVGVLPAGHAVHVDLRSAGANVALECS